MRVLPSAPFTWRHRRSLRHWYETDMPSAAGAQHPILTGNSPPWISPAGLQGNAGPTASEDVILETEEFTT